MVRPDDKPPKSFFGWSLRFEYNLLNSSPHILHAKHSALGKVNHSVSGPLPHSPCLRRAPEVWTQCRGVEPINFTAVMKQLQIHAYDMHYTNTIKKGHIQIKRRNTALLVLIKV